jgi:hypothetical protein
MDKRTAVGIIRDTFENPFDKARFVYFIKNLLNKIDETKSFHIQGQYIPESFRDYVKTYERIGTYTDPENNKIDVLLVYLQKETSLERARTAQRNFVARFLKERDEKEAGLVAFVSPYEEDWRFSLVKMDYLLEELPSGKTKIRTELTPARRFSFIVGENESSHTAQSQLISILQDDVHSPTLKQLEAAFNVEKVTKEFFEKYRELFHNVQEALEDIVSKDKKVRDDFTAKAVSTVDFAKKLLGQIVFLYFLQKKGWFGVGRDKDWGTGPKNFLRLLFDKKNVSYHNFFNDVLEPLFYEALAVERTDDFYSRFNCKISFLNGGLFDPINNYDWVHADILLPNELFSNKKNDSDEGNGILDIFDLYNFTVKEDEPLEKEVAIDPEMLGKVFENLLEVKDRKSKGTYYTPREIVHYMCQESLINYLDTAINTGDVSLVPTRPPQGKLFGQPDPEQATLKAAEYRVIVSREDIEAFVHRGEFVVEHDSRVEAHGKETERYSYKLPESIRQNARLIDEKLGNVRICDPAVGSGAFLVGMMTEIVRARNVLKTYLPRKEIRNNYIFKHHAIQNCLYGVDIDAGAVEIAKLRLWLSLVVDEEDIKQIQPLPNLDYKIICGNSLFGVEKNLFNVELFNELEKLKPLYFNETNAKKKQEFRKQIDQLIKNLTNNKEMFDFEVYFSEVFHEKGGFDVVIGNPPYLESRSPEFAEVFKDELQVAARRRWGTISQCITRGADLLIYFFEISLFIMNRNGVVVLITQNSWLDTMYGKRFQEFLIFNTNVQRIIDSDYKYFDSKEGPNINTVISVFKDKKPSKSNVVTFARFHENFDKIIFPACNLQMLRDRQWVEYSEYKYSDRLLVDTKWGILLSAGECVLDLLELLKQKGVFLGQIKERKLSIGQGLNLQKDYIVDSTSIRKYPFLTHAKIPFMTSSDGAPFELNGTDKYLIDGSKLSQKQVTQLRSEGIRVFSADITTKTKPILILPRGVSRHFCTMNKAGAFSASYVDVYDSEGTLSADSAIALNLWLFLNSSIAWLLREVSGRKNLGGGLLKAEAADLNQFPIYFEFDKFSEVLDVYNRLKNRESLETIAEIDTPEHARIDDLVFTFLKASEGLRSKTIGTLKNKISERNKKSKT